MLRTSWVMGPVGRNFALTMLRLHRERELGVVADQVGCPTSTLNLASGLLAVDPDQPGRNRTSSVLHWCDAGAASWYDLSVAVGELAMELGLLQSSRPVNPISTDRLPNPGHPPELLAAGLSHGQSQGDLEGQHWRARSRCPGAPSRDDDSDEPTLPDPFRA